MWAKSFETEELGNAIQELEGTIEEILADVTDILDLLNGYEEPNTEEAITRLKQLLHTHKF